MTIKTIEALTAAVREGLGENLVSMLAFGPSLRDDPRDIAPSVLLIVRDAAPAELSVIESALADWVKRDRPAPLIFTADEWDTSSDVFPIEIEEMREAHRLLAGEDPFTNTTTTLGDLRHQLEREVRGKLLQLRAEYGAAARDGRALGQLVQHSFDTFLVLFRATLRLTGEVPPARAQDVVEAVAAVASIDADAFRWPLEGMSGSKPRKLSANDPIGVAYVSAIETLAAFVDQHTPDRGGIADPAAATEEEVTR